MANERYFVTSLDFGTKVHIDTDRDLKGVITGFCWKDCGGHTIEVSWMHNGTSQVAWFQPWRLTKVEV